MKSYKKNCIVLIGVIILFIVIGAIYAIKYEENDEVEEVGEFNLLDYKDRIEKSKKNMTVEEISSSKIAKREAKKLFGKVFKSEAKYKRIYTVYYDKNEDVWLISATWPQDKLYLDGELYALIRTNGEVVAVWPD